MKLNFLQLETHVKKNLSSIYLISSDELTLKQEALQLLRKAAKHAGFTERVRLASDDLNAEQLFATLYSVSMFEPNKLIELDFRDHVPDKTLSKLFEDYAKNPAPNNLLILDLSKLDYRATKSAWYTALEKNGVVIPIWPINREELPKWIQARARKYKMQFQPDAANYLATQVEGNLGAAAQAIEKIYLSMGIAASDQAVALKQIETLLSDETHYTIYDFSDELIASNIERALKILASLKAENIELVLLLWNITRELRLLAEYANELKNGVTVEKVMQKHKIFSRKQVAVNKFLKKFSYADCCHLLLHAAEIDKTIKGLKLANPWQLLELFCLRFS